MGKHHWSKTQSEHCEVQDSGNISKGKLPLIHLLWANILLPLYTQALTQVLWTPCSKHLVSVLLVSFVTKCSHTWTTSLVCRYCPCFCCLQYKLTDFVTCQQYWWCRLLLLVVLFPIDGHVVGGGHWLCDSMESDVKWVEQRAIEMKTNLSSGNFVLEKCVCTNKAFHISRNKQFKLPLV